MKRWQKKIWYIVEGYGKAYLSRASMAYRKKLKKFGHKIYGPYTLEKARFLLYG